MPAHTLTLLDWATAEGVSPSVNGAVYLDATVNENHVASAETTKHKVETGSDVTDHIRPKPRKLTLEMVITNTPIQSITQPQNSTRPAISGSDRSISAGGTAPSFKAFAFDSEFDRVRECYGDLASACQAGALFRITTTLVTYAASDGSRCMAITQFGVPRAVDKSNILHGTIEFEEVLFASSQTVNVPAKNQQKKKNGAKAGKNVDETTQPKASSALFNMGG